MRYSTSCPPIRSPCATRAVICSMPKRFAPPPKITIRIGNCRSLRWTSRRSIRSQVTGVPSSRIDGAPAGKRQRISADLFPQQPIARCTDGACFLLPEKGRPPAIGAVGKYEMAPPDHQRKLIDRLQRTLFAHELKAREKPENPTRPLGIVGEGEERQCSRAQ